MSKWINDEVRASRVEKFVSALRLTEGRWAGQPFRLMPWQRKFIYDVFGQVDSRGRRRYRIAYVEIPKKNGKTPFAAALALYLLVADGEQGAQVYSAATERDQAAIVYRHAARMVAQSPALSRRLKVIDSTKTIVDHRTGSYYRAISAEARSKHGYSTSGLVFDELHALDNRAFWDTLTEGAGDAREQPLIIVITTAGYDRETVCWELHDYARKITTRQIEDDRFYPLVYSLPEEEDWEEEKNWRKVNPAIGHILDIERIREHYRATQSMPSRVDNFRRFRLCQWTQARQSYIPLRIWDESAGLLRAERLEGKPCYGGLDLASTVDIAALVLLFPDPAGSDKYYVLPNFWVPEDGARERSKRDKVPYLDWIRRGLLTATPGNVIDYRFIERDIAELASKYRIQSIAYDRWGATELVQRLQEGGLQMVPLGQGFASMAAPTRELEALVAAKRLVHGGNPVLRWMADNLVVATDPAGNRKPDKAHSTERIDGMVALIMAIDGAMRRRQHQSVYSKRGIITA